MDPSLVPILIHSLRQLYANWTLCLLPVYVAAARSGGNAVMAEAEMKLKKKNRYTRTFVMFESVDLCDLRGEI